MRQQLVNIVKDSRYISRLHGLQYVQQHLERQILSWEEYRPLALTLHKQLLRCSSLIMN